MTAPAAFRSLLSALTLSRLSPCPCLRSLPALRPISSRQFSSTLSTREQASWDSIDEQEVFQSASHIDSPSSRNQQRKRSTKFSSSSRSPSSSTRPGAPRPPRNPPRPRNKHVAPPLPPLSPLPTLETLHPLHLHSLRLALSNALRRLPSTDELARGVRTWLMAAHKVEEASHKARAAKEKSREEKKEQLDMAWEWKRQVESKAGFKRSEEDRKRDEVVFARIEMRKKRREEKEREVWDEALQADKEKKQAKLRHQQASSISSPLSSRKKDVDSDKETKDAPRALPEWQREKLALRAKFASAPWSPPKRISREAMDLVRSLARSDPEKYTTPVLADKFKTSPEAVRRILRSSWVMEEGEKERRERRRKEERMRSVASGGGGEGGGGESARSGDETARVYGRDFAAESRETAEVKRRMQEEER